MVKLELCYSLYIHRVTFSDFDVYFATTYLQKSILIGGIQVEGLGIFPYPSP